MAWMGILLRLAVFCAVVGVMLMVSAEARHCDIVVAGGSTASLAAAITAAEADPSLSVCFTEITDWPGGQMTAGGVPAIDFGTENRYLANQPASFRDFYNHVQGNPGACFVSTKCYEPDWLVKTWIMPRLAKSPNLHVFLRTAVIDTARDPLSGNVTSVTCVQRKPRDPTKEWTRNLSEELDDWYSPDDSDMFIKSVFNLTGSVFIEATELADVLMTSGLPFTQGYEYPLETSVESNPACGQVWTFTFYLMLLAEPDPHPISVPSGGNEGIPFPEPGTFDWMFSWTYRRSYCAGNRSLEVANVGDVTQQNYGNDLDNAYVLLPQTGSPGGPRTVQQPWRGGVNLTALAMLEGRAYGYFHYMNLTSPNPAWQQNRLVLNRNVSGTHHGLSKFPYLRDTRRGFGVGGYRLPYNQNLDYYNQSEPRAGYHFYDTVALGNYNDDVHHLHECDYPPYLANHTTKPYYIPFRSLTVGGAPNLLVAGKTMSQTFHANGATRLHPSEWTTGVAAGGSAVFMLHQGLRSTSDALARIVDLQRFLNSSAVGQPLLWTLDKSPPIQIGYTCGFGSTAGDHTPLSTSTALGRMLEGSTTSRCVGVDHVDKGQTLYPSATCSNHCPALASDEWLAFNLFWTRQGSQLVAAQPTILKKSTADSSVLPAGDLKPVPAGTVCQIVSAGEWESYWLVSGC